MDVFALRKTQVVRKEWIALGAGGVQGTDCKTGISEIGDKAGDSNGALA